MTEPEQAAPAAMLDQWADWKLLGLLVLLVLPLRVWLVCNTEVTARDSIGYIRYALQHEQKDWMAVWHDNYQHPGYPVAIWAVSVPVRAVVGRTDAASMQLAAQLVSFLAALLLLYPMYQLGKAFFDRTVGFGACLIYQYLPVSAHHLSDGISEPLFLLLLMSALLHAVRALHQHSVARWACSGAFVGLAYFVRPEGALLLPAVLMTLALGQAIRGWRTSWTRFLATGLAFTGVALAVGSFYVYATGRVTNKLSAREMMQKLFRAKDAGVENAEVGASRAALFAATYKKTDLTSERAFQSGKALVAELNQGFHYFGSIPALLGLCWSLGRLRRDQGFCLIAIYCLLQTTVLVALAMVVFYVSDRHVMILVIFGTYLAVVGVRELPRRVLAWRLARRALKDEAGQSVPWWRSAPVWTCALIVGMIAGSLPKSLQRLHGNRAPNHQAGLWLADNLHAGDIVDDEYGWSSYFAGMGFRAIETPPAPQSRRYVVMTRGKEIDADPKRAEHEQHLRASRAQVVYQWPDRSSVAEAKLVIYALPRIAEPK